ncbi:hypothetical protein NQ314_010329 [Rhamnusium bicolor]|uniref:Uncharacterized protein n=1 Tax=Rhamnusium bicolor TaxID=1586634 RepID=A0AAV8XSW6_9CUCU|nr:hypothetical protein NQ314_010329 [Rhamnusium bicolor]
MRLSLAQADLEAFKVTGRQDPENSPSQLAKTIEQLISELSGLFKDGIANFFSGKEADDEDEVVDPDDKEDDGSRDVGENRGKKKKKKKAMLKYLAIAAAIVAKISFLFKLFHASLQFKMFLIGLSSLLLHLAKFWLDIKRGYNPPRVVYYEQAHHQHHYDGDEGSRRYDEGGKNNAQNVVYSNQIPVQDKYSYPLPYN